MNTLKNALKRLWQDESGQGAMEYILILVVVGVLIVAFKDKIIGIIQGKSDRMSQELDTAIGNIVR